jgi:hypothetical protein
MNARTAVTGWEDTSMCQPRATQAWWALPIRTTSRAIRLISQSLLAPLGLLAVVATTALVVRPDWRHALEAHSLGWLQARFEQRAVDEGNLLATLREPDAMARATAADPRLLTSEQAQVARWLARRYKVAPEPVSALVQEAWSIGRQAGLEPSLILAIVAIESSFNPFAQSPVGAQGLMQVMTRVHDNKFEAFGGVHATFDPITNLRVGVQVLKECIARAGGVVEGLKYYVGAALHDTDGGYAARVLSEQALIKAVAQGRAVPQNAPNQLPREAASLPVAAPAAEAGPAGPAAAPSAPDPIEAAKPAPQQVASLALPSGQALAHR